MTAKPTTDDAAIFAVSGSMAFFSRLICDHPQLWRKLGAFESSVLADTIEATPLIKPIYVSGLARSGSTILLEILASAPGMVSHCYKDFPPVFTPYAWNTMLRYMGAGKNVKPSERAHKDGILVTEDSPEAMEEAIWMSFFPAAHDPAQSNVIDPNADDHGFGKFYRNHIRKLLAVRGGDRYLAKANYHVTRLEYLLKLLPDARFILPVRHPAAHISSLAKQHDLFSRGQRANPQARDHLRRVGHYEFGLDRSPINTGNEQASAEIIALWDRGEELRGWIRYWDAIYSYLVDRVTANPQLAAAARFVVFEDLCADPGKQLEDVLRHCQLDPGGQFLAAAAARIKAPTYYKSGYSEQQLAEIARGTDATMDRIRALAQ